MKLSLLAPEAEKIFLTSPLHICETKENKRLECGEREKVIKEILYEFIEQIGSPFNNPFALVTNEMEFRPHASINCVCL